MAGRVAAQAGRIAKKARTADDESPSSSRPSFGGAARSRMEAFWDEGVQKQQDGQLEAALAAFTKSQIRRQFKAASVPLSTIDPVGQCSCKDFVAAAQTRRQPDEQQQQQQQKQAQPNIPNTFPISQLDLDAVHRLATSRGCSCGSGRVRCGERSHVAVVDRMATVAVQLGRHDEALRLAQSIVDLAPQRAEGYLRLAKVVLARRSSDRFAARCIYAHGLHNVQRHGDEADETTRTLVPVLAHCSTRYGCADYLPQLPVETVEAVLAHLSLADVLRCCRVSKTWASVLRQVRVRPAVVDLGMRFVMHRAGGGYRPDAPPGLGSLARLLRRLPHLDAQTLLLTGHDTFLSNGRFVQAGDTTPFLAAVLHHFAGLESLELKLPTICPRRFADVLRHDSDLLRPSQRAHVRLLGRCRSLSLSGIKAANRVAVLGLLADAGPTLQSLKLGFLFPGEHFGGVDVDLALPRLRSLEILDGVWMLRPEDDILPRICMAAPGLQQVAFKGTCFDLAMEGAFPGYDEAVVLQNVHTLVVSHSAVFDTFWRGGVFPRLPAATMRCVELGRQGGDADELEQAVLDALVRDLPASGGMPRLEVIHSQDELSVETLGRLLQSTSGGTLQSLEICGYDMEEALLHDERLAIPHPERLRCISLSRINWDPDPGLPGYVAGRSVINWLARFPCLEIVWVELEQPDDGRLLLALVDTIRQEREMDDDTTQTNRPWAKLATISCNCNWSVTRDRAKNQASSLGITTLFTSIEFWRRPIFPHSDQTRLYEWWKQQRE